MPDRTAPRPLLGLRAHDRTSWSIVSSPAFTGVTISNGAISADSATEVWAMGFLPTSSTTAQNVSLHWDGTAWTKIPAAHLRFGGVGRRPGDEPKRDHPRQLTQHSHQPSRVAGGLGADCRAPRCRFTGWPGGDGRAALYARGR